MRSRAPLSPSSILTAANRLRPISAGLPRRPPRTGTTASGPALLLLLLMVLLLTPP
jgi:hypothetical protein